MIPKVINGMMYKDTNEMLTCYNCGRHIPKDDLCESNMPFLYAGAEGNEYEELSVTIYRCLKCFNARK